jgi:hypothetical protein
MIRRSFSAELLGLVIVVAAGFAVHPTNLHAESFGPAPKGDARKVARAAIDDAPHPCPKIISAKRLKDGSIKAECDNLEDYRIISARGQALAMRCKMVRAMNISGC